MSQFLNIPEFQNLSIGSTGLMVSKLQDWLNTLVNPYPPLQITGTFDPETAKVLARFQRANRLSVQPIVSFDTWQAIGRRIGQRMIFNDPEIPQPLKSLMAPDVIPVPGQMLLDKISFVALYPLILPSKNWKADTSRSLVQLLGFMERDGAVSDLRWFAYMLATVRMETGDFLPRTEDGCNDTGCTPITQVIRGVRRTNNRTYGRPVRCTVCPAGRTTHTYWGRGYVQLTGQANYETMSHRLGIGDALIHRPERAMEPPIAYEILSVGMREGLFTGRRLGQFISGTNADFRNARQIVNPGDTSTFDTGAMLATKFLYILEKCMWR